MKSIGLVGLCAVLGCSHKEPVSAGITLEIHTPKGWNGRRILVDGQNAAFAHGFASFTDKQQDSNVSAPLPAAVTTVANHPVQLKITPTPCGDIDVPATLTVKDEKPKQLNVAEVKVDRPPPTQTQLLFDLPGAKEVKIGSYTVAPEDLKLKRVIMYELGCEPLTITVDGKPLDAKVVDGTIEGQDIRAAKVEQPNHEFVLEQPQTQEYLITNRGGCYREAVQAYGDSGDKGDKLLTGGNIYKLAWTTVDFELAQPTSDVQVGTGRTGDHVAGTSKTAVYAVPCP